MLAPHDLHSESMQSKITYNPPTKEPEWPKIFQAIIDQGRNYGRRVMDKETVELMINSRALYQYESYEALKWELFGWFSVNYDSGLFLHFLNVANQRKANRITLNALMVWFCLRKNTAMHHILLFTLALWGKSNTDVLKDFIVNLVKHKKQSEYAAVCTLAIVSHSSGFASAYKEKISDIPEDVSPCLLLYMMHSLKKDQSLSS